MATIGAVRHSPGPPSMGSSMRQGIPTKKTPIARTTRRPGPGGRVWLKASTATDDG